MICCCCWCWWWCCCINGWCIFKFMWRSRCRFCHSFFRKRKKLKNICLEYKHYERHRQKKRKRMIMFSISNSLLVNSVNIFIVCDSYFFVPLGFFFLLRHDVYPRSCRWSMKIMMMMKIWETATSVFIKRKTTMKLSLLSQSYFHPTVHVICILGTANKKKIETKFNKYSRYCFFSTTSIQFSR